MSEWKNKLEAMDSVPIKPLDKNTAWEKLYPRLQERPRRKVRMYWMAIAACLLSVFLITRLTKTNQASVIEKPVVQIESRPSRGILQEENKARSIADSFLPQVTPVHQKIAANKMRRVITAPVNGIDTVQLVPMQENTNKLVVNIPQQELLSLVTVPIVTPKKKMRVVHINELGKPVREEGIMAQRQPTGKIYFQLNNNNNPASFSLPPANNTGRIVFNPTN